MGKLIFLFFCAGFIVIIISITAGLFMMSAMIMRKVFGRITEKKIEGNTIYFNKKTGFLYNGKLSKKFMSLFGSSHFEKKYSNHNYAEYKYDNQFENDNKDNIVDIEDFEYIHPNIITKYIKNVSEVKLKCKDTEIKTKLTELLSAMTDMEEYINSNKCKDEDDIKTITEYYLHELIEQLHKYEQIIKLPFKQNNQETIKNDIIEAVDMVTNAYHTILLELYNNDAMTLSSSLEALKAGMKLKGFAK